MKFLDSPGLGEVNNAICDVTLLDSRVIAKLELYSCKEVQSDKKLVKNLQEKHAEETMITVAAGAISPGSGSLGRSWQLSESPFAELSDKEAIKMFASLISTMNNSHVDYDFSSIPPNSFTKAPNLSVVKQEINTTLGEVYDVHDRTDSTAFGGLGLRTKLWKEVEEAIDLETCEVYAYQPDMDDDPFSHGKVWSLNHFFYHKKLRRILFFQVYAVSATAHEDDLMDDEGGYSDFGDAHDLQMED